MANRPYWLGALPKRAAQGYGGGAVGLGRGLQVDAMRVNPGHYRVTFQGLGARAAQACDWQTACPPGQLCINNKCAPMGRARCTTAADCGPLEICRGGKCVMVETRSAEDLCWKRCSAYGPGIDFHNCYQMCLSIEKLGVPSQTGQNGAILRQAARARQRAGLAGRMRRPFLRKECTITVGDKTIPGCPAGWICNQHTGECEMVLAPGYQQPQPPPYTPRSPQTPCPGGWKWSGYGTPGTKGYGWWHCPGNVYLGIRRP
jgi:hypothetical protein